MAEVVWKKKAMKQLSKIDNRYQNAIVEKVDTLYNFPDLAENIDIKKLKGSNNEYRIRIGNYRVLFSIIHDEPVIISIEAIAKRDERTYS